MKKEIYDFVQSLLKLQSKQFYKNLDKKVRYYPNQVDTRRKAPESVTQGYIAVKNFEFRSKLLILFSCIMNHKTCRYRNNIEKR